MTDETLLDEMSAEKAAESDWWTKALWFAWGSMSATGLVVTGRDPAMGFADHMAELFRSGGTMPGIQEAFEAYMAELGW